MAVARSGRMVGPMRHHHVLGCALLLLVACQTTAARGGPVSEPPGLPPMPAEGPALCVGDFLTPPQGQAALDHVLAAVPDRAAWQVRAAHQRAAILRGLGLDPLPERVPLAPIVRERRVHDGYSVENVAFTSVPGYLVTGNLYRPLRAKPPFPVVLSPHGHGEDHGRLSAVAQTRCAQLARLGALVLAIDMVAYGESLPGLPPYETHRTPLSPTLQAWNGMRSLDYLLAQEGADATRVAVTGESGGGTQTIVLTAIDPRVTVSAPVVMVSSYFFGGCKCESGKPIHRSHDHFITNAEIAALAAPRPLLLVSCGKDWTRHVPTSEFPFLQRIYALNGAPARVANAHFGDEAHDYGPSKRGAVYRFLAAHLALDLAPIQGPGGAIDDAAVTIEPAERLRVFTPEHPAPPGAWGSLADIATNFR